MPSRPVLRPGAVVVRADPRHLRVGQHPGVVVPDDPVTRTLLSTVDGALDATQVVAAVAASAGAGVAEVAARLDDLVLRGAVVDSSGWPGGVPRPELEHAVLTGTDPAGLRGRRRLRTAVRTDPRTAPLRALLEPALSLAGVASADADDDPDLLVLVCAGEPSRETLRAAARAGVTTLPVGLSDGLALVGPWHRPGRTPCLDCSDHALTTWDPAYTARLSPALATCPGDHATGVLVLQAASALVTADVLAAADGGRPFTVGHRVRLGPAAGAVRTDRVVFSPSCSCHLLSDVS